MPIVLFTGQSWLFVPPLDQPLELRLENGRFGALRPNPLPGPPPCHHADCARGRDVIEYAAWRWYGQASRGLDAPRFRSLIARLQTVLGTRAPTRVA